MSGVRVSIDSTGVVSGEFGLVEAWRAKKESLTEWLADERLAVKAFAEKAYRRTRPHDRVRTAPRRDRKGNAKQEL